ncbi:hypothetical protein C8R46DRAFT_1209242 [Mycena filopes]|nr:hypothetical protein C8R46DRAFT_1209242 [Mycena filopes]
MLAGCDGTTSSCALWALAYVCVAAGVWLVFLVPSFSSYSDTNRTPDSSALVGSIMSDSSPPINRYPSETDSQTRAPDLMKSRPSYLAPSQILGSLCRRFDISAMLGSRWNLPDEPDPIL